MLKRIKINKHNFFKFYYQLDENDCGPTCLKMLLNYFGKRVDIETLRNKSFASKNGVSLYGISQAANFFGLETVTVKLSFQKLISKANFCPCILHWNQGHFVVLVKITKSKIVIADPAYGLLKLDFKEFVKKWLSKNDYGIAMFLQPNKNFNETSVIFKTKIFSNIVHYLLPYKGKFILLFIIIVLAGFLTLLIPFITQNLIDKGVKLKDLNIVTLLLSSQLALYTGSIILEIFRNWIVLIIGTKFSINFIYDFLTKILKLPLSYFNSKTIGDFQQRIQDSERIENFCTTNGILTLFSLISMFALCGILCYYNINILLLYLTSTLIAVCWSFYWLKKRKYLDYSKFQQKSKNQDQLYQIYEGVEEIKLNQLEKYQREKWKDNQNKLFRINIRVLKLDQLQLLGYEFLNQVKNILVTFLAAYYVINNKITVGQLLSISYIIGQMNSPIHRFIAFFRSLQDAKLSLQRISEIQEQKPEENDNLLPLDTDTKKLISSQKGISIKNLSFQYDGIISSYVLKNINVFIPQGKITAIVGASGSGKTTLMKLLLKFNEPTKGRIFYNNIDLFKISPENLRKNIGVVLQNGYIFSDTIERNIIAKDISVNQKLLKRSVQGANIEKYINSLPLKYKTKIGPSGKGLSNGQKQRIQIARAIYKNPEYFFLDEATSFLDAENEKIIHNNLQEFFKGKTVVIIAHRLSTVKNADKIIVLKDGEVVEQGTHLELTNLKCEYFNLIKNQLELVN